MTLLSTEYIQYFVSFSYISKVYTQLFFSFYGISNWYVELMNQRLRNGFFKKCIGCMLLILTFMLTLSLSSQFFLSLFS